MEKSVKVGRDVDKGSAGGWGKKLSRTSVGDAVRKADQGFQAEFSRGKCQTRGEGRLLIIVGQVCCPGNHPARGVASGRPRLGLAPR
jgi:hypothetical protein